MRTAYFYPMNWQHRNYRVAFQAFGLVFLLMSVLQWQGIIRIDFSAYLENVIIFSLWWGVAAFVLYKIPFLRRNRHILLRILGLLAVLVVILIADELWGIPDSPIILPLLVLFWLGVFALLLPRFYERYQWLILTIYGIGVAYFLYVRLFTAYTQQHHEQVVTTFLLPVPALFSLWVYEQWRWLRQLQAEKSAAELALLKSQINPHFFFNTLNNLYGLAVEKSDLAPAMILKLSDIMRYTIYEGKADLVSLQDEATYLDNYIELHKIRYQKSVRINFVKQLDHPHQIAPLLLVILLENAFKHGVERLTEAASIDMELRTDANKIYFGITNNCEPESEGTAGIGLLNLRKRLALVYPDRHVLSLRKEEGLYRANLEIEPEP